MRHQFHNPTQIHWLSWRHLEELIPPPPLKVLIIVGKSSGARASELRNQLSSYDSTVLGDVPSDPTDVSVQAALDQVRSCHPEWIIAVGGGSVLDTAKAAAVLANHRGPLVDYIRGERLIESPGIPLVAVPTTAGSGSEVTPYASLTDSESKQKISLSHWFLYPRHAVLDPSLTLSCSPQQTAISGMDALAHAIEGYWSKRSTVVTDATALAAARLISEALPMAHGSPENENARCKMIEGSVLAGLTISNARTTAAHAVSYPLTVNFGVPHGLACAMLLPPFIRYNDGTMAVDKERQLLNQLGLATMGQLADTVEDLKDQINLPRRLSDLGLSKTDLPTIIDNGFRPDRMSNNPRDVSAAELGVILETIL